VQFRAPDDGRKNPPKHVERLTEINKLWNVASCSLYSANILAMHGPMNVKHPSSVKNSIFGTTKTTNWWWFQPFARCKWDICSSVILISVGSQLFTEISGKSIAPILKGQTDPWGWERKFVQKQKLTLRNLPESDYLTNCWPSWFCMNNRINTNADSCLFPVKKFSPLCTYLSCFFVLKAKVS